MFIIHDQTRYAKLLETVAMAINEQEFRNALGRFASGVTVVTAKGIDGSIRGITVSAFSSLSLAPPLVLICIDNRSSLQDHLEINSYFAVNILSEEQEFISRRCASKEPNRFEGLSHSISKKGLPLLDDALAHIECRIISTYPGGDHKILIGEVETVKMKEGNPLTYFRGAYRSLS